MKLYYEMNISSTDKILDNFNSILLTHVMNEFIWVSNEKKERKGGKKKKGENLKSYFTGGTNGVNITLKYDALLSVGNTTQFLKTLSTHSSLTSLRIS